MDGGTFELTTSPVAALIPGAAALVTGAVRCAPGGDLKLYVHARYLGIYVLIPAGGAADQIESAWRGTFTTHLWMRPAPTADMLFTDETDAVIVGLA